jgi:hypothetical protein
MTIRQLQLMSAIALMASIFVAIITRAGLRRIAGALAGAAAAGIAGFGIVTAAMRIGWWHFNIQRQPAVVLLFCLNCIFCAYVFLFTWRIARRFGSRRLAIASVAAAIIGPFRDSWYMAEFPEWGYYSPGLAPMLAISAAYVILLMVGQCVMRLVAGPAEADLLAPPIWEIRRHKFDSNQS